MSAIAPWQKLASRVKTDQSFNLHSISLFPLRWLNSAVCADLHG